MLFMGWGDGILIAQGIISIFQAGLQLVQMVYMGTLIYQIVHGSWILDQLRKFGLFFDKMLINFSDSVYSYYQQIVSGTLITPSVIDGFMTRIYMIVGIFVFFKLAIVAMRYMINPDNFSDDKIGAQTLVKRVIIGSLIMLMIPLIFDKSRDLQKYIIEDKIIEKIILPENVYNKLVANPATGKTLAMMVFRGFFNWNEAVPKKGMVYNAYDRAVTYDKIDSFNDGYMAEKSGSEYNISYVPIISTLAIGYLLFMLIKYSMEAIFRSFKLVCLQVISPIVIVNYMLDPSSNEVMKKWTNATISTYLLIFIRTITIWFATLMAYYLKNGIPLKEGEVSLLNSSDTLLKAFIVLGLFAFLKDLPKLISEIFGYNLQENETIGGIMNQGVGVLKGAALGYMGAQIAKPMTMMSMGSSMLGAAGNAAGGIGGLAKNTSAKSRQFAKSATSISGGFGSGFTSISSLAGGVMQTGLGNTSLSAAAGGISQSTINAERGPRVTYDSREKEIEKGKEKRKADKDDIIIANNISNSQQYSQYKKGDNFDLGKLSPVLDSTGKPLPNPIVSNMAEAVFDKLPADSISGNKETAINNISQKINQELEQRQIVNDCSTRQMAEVMTKVSNDLNVSSTNNSSTSTPQVINNEKTIISDSSSASIPHSPVINENIEMPAKETVVLSKASDDNTNNSKILVSDNFGGKPRATKHDGLESILKEKGGNK